MRGLGGVEPRTRTTGFGSNTMPFHNLRQFINLLQQDKDLVVVDVPVDPHLEMAEVHRRVVAANGPALLFTKPGQKPFPVVTNLFGRADRVEKAFGKRPTEFIREAASLPHELLPPTLGRLWKKRRFFWNLSKVGTRTTRSAPVFSNAVQNADLNQLPALTCWPEDGGPFLTLPLVHTQSPSNGTENLGMYRIQIHSPGEAGLHFQIGKGGGFHLGEAESRGENLPVNIYLGGPPALILAAIAPLPENTPETLLASLVLGSKLQRGRRQEAPIDPIAECEFCLMGNAPAKVRRPEGPFGDHYGYYSLTHDYPVFRPTKIWHRPNAIYPATVVGKPKQEDFYLGDYLQDLLSPLFPVVMPQVRDLWSYGQTGYHSLSAAVIQERYHREVMMGAFRILGEGQLALTKFLLVVDRPMNIRSFTAVLVYILQRIRWERDVYIFAQLSMDTLDYTGPEVNKGSKGILIGSGEQIRDLPETIQGESPERLQKPRVFCPGCLVVEGPSFSEDSAYAANLATHSFTHDWQLVVVVDDSKRALASETSFLWTTFTRFEPARDMHFQSQKVIANQVVSTGPLVIDARMKPWYPDELFCDPQTAEKVSSRWTEYFPDRNVEMGSSDWAHLHPGH